jgi:oxygen tolerance protein BatD
MSVKSILILFLLFFSQYLYAEVSVSVDRNPVVTDESFQLIFETDKKIKGEPDFSSLKKILTILNTGHRSNTQIINSSITQTHQWILTAIANKTGLIEIPAIRFGNELSKPFQIKVVNSTPPSVGSNQEDIFIDIDVNKSSPYVQEQIVYTVKLYRAVQTSNASLSEPELSGGQAVINKLGEDKSFEIRIKGKRYVVIQRQYVIFPQASGLLKIEPLIFQGQTGTNRFFSFDPFGPQPKSIAKRSDSIVLDIKPIPDSFTGDTWLPASLLNIQEQWSVDPSKLKEGEATTRTLTLTANGLSSSQLPKINSTLPDNLKQYPDQPELEESNNGNGVLGVRREKMAIIPASGGDYILPAIKIPWWNTETDKMEIAELPERTIHVITSNTSKVDNDREEQSIREEQQSPEPVSEENSIIVNEEANINNYWKWLSMVFFVLWITTLLILVVYRKQNVINNEQDSNELSSRYHLKRLKQSCKDNNAEETKKELLAWARNKWPEENINNINSIKPFTDRELQLRIDELNRYLYSQQETDWDGSGFLKCFEQQSFENQIAIDNKGKLEPLYKG